MLVAVWILICAIGFGASLFNCFDSYRFLQLLETKPAYAPLIYAHKIEMVWDAALAASLGLLTAAALVSFLPPPIRSAASLATLLAAVSLLTATAVGRYVIRHRHGLR